MYYKAMAIGFTYIYVFIKIIISTATQINYNNFFHSFLFIRYKFRSLHDMLFPSVYISLDYIMLISIPSNSASSNPVDILFRYEERKTDILMCKGEKRTYRKTFSWNVIVNRKGRRRIRLAVATTKTVCRNV